MRQEVGMIMAPYPEVDLSRRGKCHPYWADTQKACFGEVEEEEAEFPWEDASWN
jgi:hypothetical protein